MSSSIKERAREMALERAALQPARPPVAYDCDPSQTDGECPCCMVRQGDHSKNCRHHDPLTDAAWARWKDELPAHAPAMVKRSRAA